MTSPLLKADIFSRLKRFLDRRTMPRSLEGKPQAVEDELEAMVRVIEKHAGSPLSEWWPRFEERIGETGTTRSWPTLGEIVEVCRLLREGRKTIAEAGDFDTFAINANRIRAGEKVGDGFLWGRMAVEMIRRGLVTEDELSPYRSHRFFAEKDLYGEEIALDNERQRKAKHAAALEMPSLDAPRTERRQVQIPDKRMSA